MTAEGDLQEVIPISSNYFPKVFVVGNGSPSVRHKSDFKSFRVNSIAWQLASVERLQ